ncbi:hypothetical protein BJV78DRAFT_1279084 [Lactifluus subvellereus]|nr:hypothetical protein BJV78DRAFT_1279084 [Lactifluus subvellereus]
MEYCYFPSRSPQTTPAPFGQLSELLYCGYLGQTFGPLIAKRHICHNLLDYIEDDEDLVVRQHLLRPDLSYPGLPGTFSVPQNLYSHLRCNSIGTDGSYRIILDCYIVDRTTRVIPQDLFAPYAGLPRSRAELQNASLVPPIFFIQADYSVGLPLGVAKSVADARTPPLLYDSWSPMEGKASIKLRIAWYGYNPWQTQIQLRNRRKEPITLPRLVQLVASGVERFLQHEHGPVVDHSFPQWRIGDGPYGVSPARIVLVGVVAVSSGSIMPIMRLAN